MAGRPRRAWPSTLAAAGLVVALAACTAEEPAGRAAGPTPAAGTTVTLTVPAAERRHLALLYDPAAWKEDNRYRLGDGDTAVTFRSCPPEQTPPGADHP